MLLKRSLSIDDNQDPILEVRESLKGHFNKTVRNISPIQGIFAQPFIA